MTCNISPSVEINAHAWLTGETRKLSLTDQGVWFSLMFVAKKHEGFIDFTDTKSISVAVNIPEDILLASIPRFIEAKMLKPIANTKVMSVTGWGKFYR
jgi:hypothetical protein